MILQSKMTPFSSNEEKFEINKNEIVQTMQCKMLNSSKTVKHVNILYTIHVAY